MDVERVRQIADQLRESGEALTTLGATGRAQLSVLSGAWEGSDLDTFHGSWGGAEKSLAAASSSIQTLGKQLGEQAGEQDEASAGAGSVLSGGGKLTGGAKLAEPDHGIPFLENASTIIGGGSVWARSPTTSSSTSTRAAGCPRCWRRSPG